MCLTFHYIKAITFLNDFKIQQEILSGLWHWIWLAQQKKMPDDTKTCRDITCVTFVEDIRHYFSIEAEHRMEQASHEGSQIDRVG